MMTLAKHIELLEQQTAAYQAQLAAAQARIDELLKQSKAQAVQIARLMDRIDELLAALGRAGERKEKEKEKKLAAPKHLTPEQQRAFDERPKPPKSAPKKKRKRTPKRPGRNALPKHLPADEHHLTPEVCSACGHTELEPVEVLHEEKLDVVREHVRRRVVHRTTCVCKHCGQRNTARSLPAPFGRSKATSQFLAWMVAQKFELLVPLDRIRKNLETKGVKLAPSYMVSQVERVADIMAVVDGEHWKQLLSGDWMATDATGLQVLIPGAKGSYRGHLEVYRRDDLVVMQYEPDKSAGPLASKLKTFEGILVADAEHRHNRVFDSGKVLEAGCNAHGRRKLRDAESTHPILAKEGGAFISAMYVEEAKAQELQLRGDRLRQWRQEKIAPIRDEFRLWLDTVLPSLIPDDPLAKVLQYYVNHWAALFRFIDYPEIPIDNSASEREFQRVAKLRLNSFFAGSAEGAHRIATLMGLAATCRAIGVNYEHYLGWALDRLGTHRDVFGLKASELTPAAFARTVRAGPGS